MIYDLHAHKESLCHYFRKKEKKKEIHTFLIRASLSLRATEWKVPEVELVYLSSVSNVASFFCKCFTMALSDMTALT